MLLSNFLYEFFPQFLTEAPGTDPHHLVWLILETPLIFMNSRALNHQSEVAFLHSPL